MQDDVEQLVMAMESNDKVTQDVILDKLLKPKAGRVPMYGKGVTPTDLKRKRFTADAMDAEVERLAAEKVAKLRTIMAQQMVSQFETAFPELQIPNDLANDLIASTMSNNANDGSNCNLSTPQMVNESIAFL